MMKTKTLFSAIALSAALFPAFAANNDNRTLFIYHSEGVEPILFSEIESIRLSDTDIDGTQLPDLSVQEFCTQDTVYRYRIADIKKVSFQNPPTIANRGAIDLAGPLAPYIKGVDYEDKHTLALADNVPAELIPKVGDMLYQLEPSEVLDCGFAGKVEKVDGTVIIWEGCQPDDIFESLAFSKDIESAASPAGKLFAPEDQIPWYAADCHLPYQTVNIMTDELKDITVGSAHAYVDAKVRIQPIISCQTGIYVFPSEDASSKPVKVRKMHSAVRLNVEARADGRCLLEKEETGKTGEPIVIRSEGIGLGQKMTAKFTGSVKGSGKMGVDYSYKASYNSSAVTSVFDATDDAAITYTSASQHVTKVPEHSLDASLSGKLSLSGIISLTVTGVTDSLKSITQSYTYGPALSGEAFYKKSEIAEAHTNNALYVRLTSGGVKASPVENISSTVKYASQTLKYSGKITVTPGTDYYAIPKFGSPTYSNGVLKYNLTGSPMKSVRSKMGTAVKDADSKFTFVNTDKEWPGPKSFEATPDFSIEKGDVVYPTATLDGEVILGSPQYPGGRSALTQVITYAVSGGARIVSGTPYFAKATSNGISVVMGTPPGWVYGKKKK